MSRIRGKHTTPEKAVRSLLHRLGYRFRLHVRIPIASSSVQGSKFKVQGSRFRIRGPEVRSVCPDILLPKHKTAIFVHGCFPALHRLGEGGWHRYRGCPAAAEANCRSKMVTKKLPKWVK
jgi:DNA mismatch endonuclease (patch repair protein)